jgi:hypothetical protein
MYRIVFFILGVVLIWLGWDFETTGEIITFVAGVISLIIPLGEVVLEAFD